MTATTLTLTDFLLARIAEDEAVARKMDERHDWSQSWELDLLYDDGPCIAVTRARVLAECEAKRRIVELHDWIRRDGLPRGMAALDARKPPPSREAERGHRGAAGDTSRSG